jgi:hypothetical protein
MSLEIMKQKYFYLIVRYFGFLIQDWDLIESLWERNRHDMNRMNESLELKTKQNCHPDNCYMIVRALDIFK